MGVSISKCKLPILGVTLSLFDTYLAFQNVNEMYCKYIYSRSYAKCKRDANVMQMKCNANKCKKCIILGMIHLSNLMDPVHIVITLCKQKKEFVT